MIKDINAITPEYMKYRIEQETGQYKQEIGQYKQEIERLHSIIKEVREYIEKHIAMFKNGDMLVDMNIDELLEILGREND